MKHWKTWILGLSLVALAASAWAGPPRARRANHTARQSTALPRPVIEVKVNGRAHDGVSVISKKARIAVTVKAARGERGRYEVDSASLHVRRSLGRPTRLNAFEGEGGTVQVALGNRLRSDPPGTIIYVKLGRVRRRVSPVSIVDVRIPEREKWIPLVIK